MLKSGEQLWSDGPVAGMGVQLKYEGGSMRGGCAPENRSTTIVGSFFARISRSFPSGCLLKFASLCGPVECDPCKLKNITKVEEPTKCQYKLTIASIAGCATNKPPPAASCPHICDLSTMTCKAVSSEAICRCL